MTVTIERLDIDQLEKLDEDEKVEIEKWIFELRGIKQTIQETVDGCRNTVNRLGASFFLVYLDDRLVGFSRLYDLEGNDRQEIEKRISLPPKKYSFLSMVVIDPEMRHQGIGRQMIERIIFGLDNGQTLCIEVKEGGSTPFWEKLGFKKIGEYARYGSKIQFMGLDIKMELKWIIFAVIIVLIIWKFNQIEFYGPYPDSHKDYLIDQWHCGWRKRPIEKKVDPTKILALDDSLGDPRKQKTQNTY